MMAGRTRAGSRCTALPDRAWELDEVVEVPVTDRAPKLGHGAVGVVARAVDVHRLPVPAERDVASPFVPVPQQPGTPGEVGVRLEAHAPRVIDSAEDDVPR